MTNLDLESAKIIADAIKDVGSNIVGMLAVLAGILVTRKFYKDEN